MGGRILAIREEFGYRPLMVVRTVTPIPQLNERPPSTVFYGNQLMFQYDNRPGWVTFMKTVIGQRVKYSQLAIAKNETEQVEMEMFPRTPWIPILEEDLVMLRGGHDPIMSYYVQFAGQPRIFTQPDWWKEDEEF